MNDTERELTAQISQQIAEELDGLIIESSLAVVEGTYMVFHHVFRDQYLFNFSTRKRAMVALLYKGYTGVKDVFVCMRVTR